MFKTFINYGFLEYCINFPQVILRFSMILIYSKFSLDFYKNNENAAILKITKISEIATADVKQISQSSLKIIQFTEKFDAILHPPYLKSEIYEPNASWQYFTVLTVQDITFSNTDLYSWELTSPPESQPFTRHSCSCCSINLPKSC